MQEFCNLPRGLRRYSTLHTPHFPLHTPHSTLCTPHSALYTPHSTLYTLHSTLHTLHSTLHTLHSTPCIATRNLQPEPGRLRRYPRSPQETAGSCQLHELQAPGMCGYSQETAPPSRKRAYFSSHRYLRLPEKTMFREILAMKFHR